MYVFSYYDGNNGTEIAFDTFKGALKEAENKWSHLTKREKIKYTDISNGAYFCVFEKFDEDDWDVIVDFAYKQEVE